MANTISEIKFKLHHYIRIIFFSIIGFVYFSMPYSAQSQFIQQHVVLVIIDGARYTETFGDPTGQFIPRMHQLKNQAAVVDTFLNDSLTYTSRAIPAIWCGSWSPPRDTVYNSISTQYATVPTVWEYIRKDRNLDTTNAMYILKNLSSPWLQSFHHQYGPSYWPWYIMQEWSDLYVWNNAKSKLATHHPIFSVIYLADVDAAGHTGVWNTYTRAITIADSIVGMLWDFVQSDPIYQDRTTVIVTNDHGRHSDGVSSGFVSHGDACWGCRRVQFMAIGPGVKKGFSVTKRKITDITPTIGSLLNFTTPYSTGNKMSEILKPIISYSPKILNFDSVLVNTSKTDSFKVYNSGGADLTISVNIPSTVSVNPQSVIIPPHQFKTFIATYHPTTPDSLSGYIIINHNDTKLKDSIKVVGKGYTNLISVSVNIRNGWNLISLPAVVTNPQVNSVFPRAVSKAFLYSNGYISKDSLNKSTGYWLKCDTSSNVQISGIQISSDTVDVSAGWNLIGSISYPVSTSSIITIPDNIINSSFYTYNGTYFISNTILPGYGYWVKVNSNGKIILSSTQKHKENK